MPIRRKDLEEVFLLRCSGREHCNSIIFGKQVQSVTEEAEARGWKETWSWNEVRGVICPKCASKIDSNSG